MRNVLWVGAVVVLVVGLWGGQGVQAGGYSPYDVDKDGVPVHGWNDESKEASQKGMSVNALRAWKADQQATNVRSERQSLFIGGGVAVAGIALAVALYLSRAKRKD